ncbi:MAG TPA: PAS domain-containing protein [Aliidongia sp.]|uniref:PAS domain-containing protein n=1 Tax=Aliidongia sp. TaxID=1914230 RepID=UPI002DDD7AC1|nr:PAS domain-containing protein [Aliidongia sp.]HEV2678626.1 PAS domain-containing protein [Aliidongia sp.]
MIEAGEFRATLRTPELIQLFDYWQTIRGGRLMPRWSDIRPEEIAPVLPRVWAWRVTVDGDLQLRLVGEKILEVLRRNVRGQAPEDLYPADEAADIRHRLLKVAQLPTCSVTSGDIFDAGEKVGTGERLALPYADVHGGLGIIGASKAKLNPDPATGIEMPFKPKALYTLVGTEYYMKIDGEAG